MPFPANEPAEGRLRGGFPDESGHFGPYGGTFVAETLMGPVAELREAYAHYRRDPAFLAEFEAELRHYVGRPSPLYLARRWSDELGGARVYLKREDLNHTGAHKVNNTVGQALLAQRMGKRRIIAETGRATYVAINDEQALAAFHRLTRREGIIPALESSHALAFAERLAPGMERDDVIVVNLSGRGDKDIPIVAALEGLDR